jgi:hypothetical protein
MKNPSFFFAGFAFVVALLAPNSVYLPMVVNGFGGNTIPPVTATLTNTPIPSTATSTFTPTFTRTPTLTFTPTESATATPTATAANGATVLNNHSSYTSTFGSRSIVGEVQNNSASAVHFVSVVADIYNGTASFNQGLLTFNVNYPLWPKLLKANFSQTNPSVSQLDGVILPWATALNFDQTKLSADAVATKLAQSSANAWLLPGSTNVNPAEILRPTGEIKQFTLAASISGPMKSAYSNSKSQHSDLIVVADSDFIKDDFVKGAYGNLIFMQNLIDGVTLDSRLASIRSKDITTRSIKDQGDQQKQFITMFNIFGVTFLVAILGALRYYWRKKSKTLEIKVYE